MKKNYIKAFWRYVESENTKISNKVENWLNYDNLRAIIVDGDVFWVELVCSTSTLPNSVFKYIKWYMKRQGYKYLYNR